MERRSSLNRPVLGFWGDGMLYPCSLGWVDVFRPLGVHMGPILENWGGWGQGGHQADFTRGGGHKYVSLLWWQFWCLGTPKWTKNLVSTHSKLSKMVFAIFLGLSGPKLGQIRRPSWKIWDAGVPICITGNSTRGSASDYYHHCCDLIGMRLRQSSQ